VHGESGQAAVEWVALVLVAALVLGAAAALSPRSTDRELGELVAKRITGAPRGAAAVAPRAGAVPPPVMPPRGAPRRLRPRAAPPASAPRDAPAPSARAAPPASTPRAVNAFRRLRGVSEVAKRAWILCLGYRRWRYELEHPSAPTEVLPLSEALSIVNTCFNPYDYLLED
jgi:hypothetical protein